MISAEVELLQQRQRPRRDQHRQCGHVVGTVDLARLSDRRARVLEERPRLLLGQPIERAAIGQTDLPLASLSAFDAAFAAERKDVVLALRSQVNNKPCAT